MSPDRPSASPLARPTRRVFAALSPLFLAACVFGLRIISPEALGLGAGIITCLGLGAMSAADGRSLRYG